MRFLLVTVLLGVWLGPAANAGAVKEQLFFQNLLDARGQGGVPFIEANRLFALNVPQNWQPRAFPDKPDFVEFRVMGAPGTAWLQVQRLPVAEGARAKQLLLRAVEQRLRKLPHFSENSRRDVMINGIRGASVSGDYWYQGNAQYPRAIEEIFLVIGKDAFELHFECFEPLGPRMAQELDRVYGSFVARPPKPAAGASSPTDEEPEDPLDSIPF